jgi:hypothetical protein
MGGLNVHADDESSVSQSQKKKWFKSPKVILGICALIAIPVVGTTFAATTRVAINNNNGIAFGQGNSAALACDETVTITPHAWFSRGSWYLSSVTISNLDTTSGQACDGKTITLAGYTSNNTNTEQDTTIAESESTIPLISSSPYYSSSNYVSSTWTSTTFPDLVAVDGYNSANTKITITYGDKNANPGVAFSSAYEYFGGFTIQQG